MYYRGLMDGWHGDEDECNGHCGSCDQCLEIIDNQGENDYDVWKLDQLSIQDGDG